MNVPFYAASVKAAPEPIYPTQKPHVKLDIPVNMPAANTAYAFLFVPWNINAFFASSYLSASLIVFHDQSAGLFANKMETITP